MRWLVISHTSLKFLLIFLFVSILFPTIIVLMGQLLTRIVSWQATRELQVLLTALYPSTIKLLILWRVMIMLSSGHQAFCRVFSVAVDTGLAPS